MPDDDRVGVRGALSEAAEHFVGLVGDVPRDRRDGHGTREWSVLELVAHTGRAFLATERVVASPVDPATPMLASAADYYRAAFAVAGVHAGITARGRAAAVELGEDPAAAVRRDLDRVAPLVAATPLEQVVQHFAGRIRFGDYLVTRVTELVLHSVDLQLALGWSVEAPHRAASLVRDVVLELASTADPLAVACALAGREGAGRCDVLS